MIKFYCLLPAAILFFSHAVLAADGDEKITSVDVYRLSGVRHLKITTNFKRNIYLPSIGMDPEAKFSEAVCPSSLKEDEANIEIRKNVEISSEIQEKSREIFGLMNKCRTVKKVETPKKKSTKPQLRFKKSTNQIEADSEAEPESYGVEVDAIPPKKPKKK